jgi:hypothetical protein
MGQAREDASGTRIARVCRAHQRHPAKLTFRCKAQDKDSPTESRKTEPKIGLLSEWTQPEWD